MVVYYVAQVNIEPILLEFSLVLADKLFNVLEHSEPGSVLADVTFCVQHHTHTAWPQDCEAKLDSEV